MIEVINDPARAESSRGRKAYTLLIDGQPTMYWCPNEHAANRVKRRLELGRSGEAFGGAGVAVAGAGVPTAITSRGHDGKGRGKVVSVGEVTTETVVMKSGREKAKEKRPGFIFELDGKAHEDKVVTSEHDAKALCAITAFATRGKLNPKKFAEAEAAFKDQFGFECKVQCVAELGHKIVAKDAKGGIWQVGFRSDGGAVKFAQVVPATPGK